MTDAGVPFGNYQYEIYLKGVAGETPGFPMGWADLESAAAAAMDEGARGYVFGSAGTQATERANLAAFDRWRAHSTP